MSNAVMEGEMIKYYECEVGLLANGAQVDGDYELPYSICIKAEHYPNLDEAEKFLEDDLKKLGYDCVHRVTLIEKDEVHSFFDTIHIDKWKILA